MTILYRYELELLGETYSVVATNLERAVQSAWAHVEQSVLKDLREEEQRVTLLSSKKEGQ